MGSEISGIIQSNKIHYLAIEVRGKRIKMFVNGTWADTIQASGNLLNSPLPLSLGSINNQSEFFLGTLKEVNLANSQLDSAAVEKKWKKVIDSN